MPIYFYSTRDNYGCFSNFSAHGISSAVPVHPVVFHSHPLLRPREIEASKLTISVDDLVLQLRNG